MRGRGQAILGVGVPGDGTPSELIAAPREADRPVYLFDRLRLFVCSCD